MIEYKTQATQNLITETFAFTDNDFGLGNYAFQKSIDYFNSGYYINLLYYGLNYTGANSLSYFVNNFSLIDYSSGIPVSYDFNYAVLNRGAGYFVTKLNYIGSFNCASALVLTWDTSTSVIDTGDKWIGFIAYTITKQ